MLGKRFYRADAHVVLGRSTAASCSSLSFSLRATRRWRKQDSKRRSLSQNTSVRLRKDAAKKGGLEPSHHLSGTDISNRSSSSRESAGNSGNRATQMALVRYYSPMGESWQATAYRKGLTGIIPGCFTVFYNVKRA